MSKSWNDVEDDEDEDSVFEEKEGKDNKEQNKKNKVKETKRPNAQKFAEIMKATDAFPTLENQFVDASDSDN